MSLSGSNYVQLIQGLKAEKVQTIEDTRQLRDELDRVQGNAYNIVVQLNAEIANKYFKEINHDIPFSTRINAAVSLMENEIKRLDLGMDMVEYIDEELDARLDHLKTQLAIWGSLRNEIRSPVQESATFKKAVEILERSSRDDFPVVDSLMQIQGEENKFLENASALADSVHAIVQRHEIDMNKRIAQVDVALRENITQMMDNLSQQGDYIKGQLQDRRQEHREALNNMYGELLSKFLEATEASNNQINAAYHKMERRKPHLADTTNLKTHGEKSRVLSPNRVKSDSPSLPPPPPVPAPPVSLSQVVVPPPFPVSTLPAFPQSQGVVYPPPPPPPHEVVHPSPLASEKMQASIPPPPALAVPPPPPAASYPPLAVGGQMSASAKITGSSASASATTAAVNKSWKSEIDQLYMTALREDRQRRELEAQLDDALLAEFDEAKITVLDHGMGDEYLHTLMEKLTALYIESNEIDLKRAHSLRSY